MKELPEHIKEEQRILYKYLYPIMYSDKKSGINVIYSDEFDALMKDVNSNMRGAINEIVTKRKIPVINSSLTIEEQDKFIEDFLKKIDKEEEINESEMPDDKEQLEDDKGLNIFFSELFIYFLGNAKAMLDKAVTYDMPYYIEHINFESDTERALLLCDIVINSKDHFLMANPDIINENVKRASFDNIPLKDVIAYYGSDVLGPNNSIKLSDEKKHRLKILANLCKGYYEELEKNHWMNFGPDIPSLIEKAQKNAR